MRFIFFNIFFSSSKIEIIEIPIVPLNVVLSFYSIKKCFLPFSMQLYM